MKRIFDVFVSLIGLILCLPIFIILLILIYILENKYGIIALNRVGQNNSDFKMYKFRTLKNDYGSSIVTSKREKNKLGFFLRSSKLDELPQLINVFFGSMSLVGPRPDVREIIELTPSSERDFLKLKPGITGPAQIKYSKESEILDLQKNPEKYYKEIIWKDKVLINNLYYKHHTFLLDLKYLYKTIF